MEIEVGEYVRTRNQGIKKVKKIEYDIDAKENYYYFDNVLGEWEHQIIKHSNNIIDLIEAGDYVNGFLIEYIERFKAGSTYLYYKGNATFVDYQIKTIVTKEQFELVEYKIEEEK